MMLSTRFALAAGLLCLFALTEGRADVAALLSAEKAGTLKCVPVASTWLFRADGANEGVQQQWFAPKADTASWEKSGLDRRKWGTAGFRSYSGWGWVRMDVDAPEGMLSRRHCYLLFAAVDEECVVYVNGKQACEHTSSATGIAPGRLWNSPFLVDAKPFMARPGKQVVTLRIHCPTEGGGLCKPALLMATDAVTDAQSAYDFGVAKRSLKPIERDFQRAGIPRIPASPNQAQFGRCIQRTVNLLAGSTATHRHRVRILFYGQSIVAGMHCGEIVNTLRRQFPYAVISAANRAIGGFTAPSLIRPAYHDLYPFGADLVVFHVYGGEKTGQLESIIADMRKQNTSDIMVYTHQIAWIDSEEKLARRTASDDASSAKMRELAGKYHCELVEVREEWREYLKAHEMGINELMGNKVKSNVHPNTDGHTLLAQLVLRHFQHHPDSPGRYAAARKTYRPGDTAVSFTGPAWQTTPQGWLGQDAKSRMELTFEGNRVDLVAFPAANVGSAKILIDGRAPSEFPHLYRCTRPSGAPYVWWPGVKRVTLSETPLPILETWTMTLSDVDKEKGSFGFTLQGSVTGEDGAGARGKGFVSNSGRIHIAARDFNVLGALRYRKKECPPGFKITWRVAPLFVEQWQPRVIPDPSIEEIVTLVWGLANERHTIEIVPAGDGGVPIKALVAHCPPLR